MTEPNHQSIDPSSDNKKESLNLPIGKKKSFRSLSRTILFWFLLLSLFPLSLVSWLSYQQAQSSLTREAAIKLEQSAFLNVRFIQNWFDYRFMDLNIQAEDQHSIELLSSLSRGFAKSQLPIEDYIKSFDWARRVDTLQQNFISLSRHYDYIYDIFLIDTQGNILFSVAHEADLGTNLFNGPYSDTRFSETVQKTLTTGKSLFSDLERYAPSAHIFAGFLSAPVLDESGAKIGALAVQLKLTRLFNAMKPLNSQSTMKHYLVGKDGYLRSTLKNNDESMDDVLTQLINSEQFELWHNEHSEVVFHPSEAHELAFKYTGPSGQSVIGIHNVVKLPGVQWALVSEVDESEALAPALWLRNITLFLVFMTIVIVTILAIFLSRRITRPIIQLANKAMSVAAGDINTRVDIVSNNEIGHLVSAFNNMLLVRQNHEQALQESTNQAKLALFELEEQKFALDQHAIVAITDVKGTITYVNKRFEEISGYSKDELIGHNYRLLNSGQHDEQFWKQMYRTISHGKVWHNEICNKSRNGQLYWVDTTIVPFKDEQGKPKSYVAIRTDITERKQAESELIHAKEMAEAAVVAKSEFLASMSHEIRTPMNGVLGMLGLVLNTPLNNEQHHRISLAQSSANALLTLINDILDFSKVEAGKLELEILDFNLRSLLGEFAEVMALQAHEKGLEVILDVTGVEHSMIRSDPGRLRQILTNLVGNAIKFTEQGEIILAVKLLNEELQPDKYRLHARITDTGIGIPKDKQDTLFDSFSQVDTSTTRKYGGTGLGLAIAKKLCELMDGSITVNSEPGQGSCFEFNILVENSEQSSLVIPDVDMTTLKLLVVDDNTTNREVLSGQLEHWGAEVTEAKSGEEALSICAARAQNTAQNNEDAFFDIAFLDMQMPEMDGAQLSQAIKADERFRSMKLVMMTSMSNRGDADYFARLGFSAYFPKPATTSDLFAALAVVAEGGEVLQQATPLVTHDYLQTLAHNEQEANAGDASSVWPENIRLLLVEDNRVNQLVAKGILKNLGLQADVAANGCEALSSLKAAESEKPYTIILMDCQMPEMDGYEASQLIRSGEGGQCHQAVPIIAMTANVMLGDREKCLAAGMSDYLSKPIDSERVARKLHQWLGKKEDGKEIGAAEIKNP